MRARWKLFPVTRKHKLKSCDIKKASEYDHEIPQLHIEEEQQLTQIGKLI